MNTSTNPPGAAFDRELAPTERELLVRSAILAPSMHNTQPWQFRFRHRTIEVHRDRSLELPAEDPDGRLAMIGVGAAVFNIRVAAATLARATVTVLLPDPERRPTLAAEVTLAPGLGCGTDLAGLFLDLPQRRTNRQPFSSRRLPRAVQEALELAAIAEGTRLRWANHEQVRWLQHVASDADHADGRDLHRIVERGSWVGGDRDRDGVPSASLGPRSAELPSPVRDLAVDPIDGVRGTALFEPDPTLAILATTLDNPPNWLAAGQALQRVLLVATHYELAASLLNQPVEHSEFRGLLHDPHDGWTATQVVLRLGYGPTVPPTPRRPHEEFILDD
ncbi:MAG TPA: hypothetical protein VE287_09960 [Actinopolymorphaceae bacterium]|nr:hypothetical protein [Actinopolymorphaceae bacterium]